MGKEETSMRKNKNRNNIEANKVYTCCPNSSSPTDWTNAASQQTSEYGLPLLSLYYKQIKIIKTKCDDIINIQESENVIQKKSKNIKALESE